jgi:hypothetical protein
MHRIIYLSTAIHYLEEEEISTLLKQSRAFNSLNNISGVLLYIDGDFIQVLEGKKDVICALFERIKRDKRHKGIICVINDKITERQFSNWSMGYHLSNYRDLKKLHGFENINKEEFFNFKDHTAVIFLETFIKSHRDEMTSF